MWIYVDWCSFHLITVYHAASSGGGLGHEVKSQDILNLVFQIIIRYFLEMI